MGIGVYSILLYSLIYRMLDRGREWGLILYFFLFYLIGGLIERWG
jgi:hypothetical protein